MGFLQAHLFSCGVREILVKALMLQNATKQHSKRTFWERLRGCSQMVHTYITILMFEHFFNTHIQKGCMKLIRSDKYKVTKDLYFNSVILNCLFI